MDNYYSQFKSTKWNYHLVVACLNNKKIPFDLKSYSRKDLEFICSVAIQEYKRIKTLNDIMQNYRN